MQKRISPAEFATIRVVIVTLDDHFARAIERAAASLGEEILGLRLSLHAASRWAGEPATLEATKAAIAEADIIIVSMLFLDDQIQAILPALKARRDACDAMAAIMSAGEVVALTKLGRLDMSKPTKGPLALLKRLRGKRKQGSSGAGQMAMLRRLPKILRFIPGKAQDLRAYFLTMQYWLTGSDENVVNMVRLLVDRYAQGARAALRGALKVEAPVDYPDVGLYHPRMPGRVGENLTDLPKPPTGEITGTVGLIVMRSYVLSKDTGHYDGMIAALEARGLQVIPVFAAGLDSRPAVERFCMAEGQGRIDALLSLTGFSLVGGPAYNDCEAAEEMLSRLDVPYFAAHALEFQSLQQWGGSSRGLMPIESTVMVAIPELDGATRPTVFGGRSDGSGPCVCGDPRCITGGEKGRDMRACVERAERLAARVERVIALRREERAGRRVAIVLFNFPPNAGATGTAAFLSVFESLHNTLKTLASSGYAVEVPSTVDALREAVLEGNAARLGTDANVHARVPAEEIVRAEPHLAEIEGVWGAAPGRQLSDGAAVQILGARFGNVFVGIQPGFGWEGDPMRLLFEKGFAPTHAFSTFYRWIERDFGAHAVLHFGTHGALEFMPGKQSGPSGACWPDRLIGDLPNLYLYAANNPSEGMIAKRRAGATLISYLTPPLTHAGLYRDLADLKASLERWRGATDDLGPDARARLAEMIQAQAATLDLADAEPAWPDPEARIGNLTDQILELEYTLIPHGLHVVGEAPSREERADLLATVAEAQHGLTPDRDTLLALTDGETVQGPAGDALTRTATLLAADHEAPAIVKALDGRYIAPAPGGDLIRSDAILPTGRNIHGFDPFRIPSAFAVEEGRTQAERMLARHRAETGRLPEQVALVLWGTDNLKQEGGPLAQALALIGARPRLDSYGRVAGAELIPAEEVGRPRVDVMMTLSGIFRDLLPVQTRMLAEAAFLAATADEPDETNFVAKHARAYAAKTNCDMETAALRVFSNAEGAYGSNVNFLVDSGAWEDADELAQAYANRKCFAYGVGGEPKPQPELLETVLSDVELAYQNLDSVELGVTTIDHYFDTLGGIGRAARRAQGSDIPVYIGDQTRGEGKVRTLAEQVALETRTRTLNPKYFEGLLKHGAEGVRQIEASVTNTVGWSATTGAVDPWVYQRVTETFVLDEEMRKRLAEMNPKASARMAGRLLEAHERQFWSPDDETLAALQAAADELEDQLEGVAVEANPVYAA